MAGMIRGSTLGAAHGLNGGTMLNRKTLLMTGILASACLGIYCSANYYTNGDTRYQALAIASLMLFSICLAGHWIARLEERDLPLDEQHPE